MENQMSFTDIEYSNRKRTTKREAFLDCMDEVIQGDEVVALIKPHYNNKPRGYKAIPIETMFRMLLLQRWYNLSDEALEDAIYDSYAMRKFMHLNFVDESVLDATTLCEFRELVVDDNIDKLFFESIQKYIADSGYIMRGGTIVDAIIVDAPKSTKNQTQEPGFRDAPNQEGNQWYFGTKHHVDVDARTGLVHTFETTAANVRIPRSPISCSARMIQSPTAILHTVHWRSMRRSKAI